MGLLEQCKGAPKSAPYRTVLRKLERGEHPQKPRGHFVGQPRRMTAEHWDRWSRNVIVAL